MVVHYIPSIPVEGDVIKHDKLVPMAAVGNGFSETNQSETDVNRVMLMLSQIQMFPGVSRNLFSSIKYSDAKVPSLFTTAFKIPLSMTTAPLTCDVNSSSVILVTSQQSNANEMLSVLHTPEQWQTLESQALCLWWELNPHWELSPELQRHGHSIRHEAAVTIQKATTHCEHYKNIKHTQIGFTSPLLSLDDFMTFPRQSVEHTGTVSFGRQGSTCITQQCSATTADI